MLCKTMDSIKNKVREFVESHPSCRSFLQDIVDKREDEIKKEENDFKERKAFDKAKKLFEYDVTNFKKPVLQGFKYKLEMLENDDGDYKFLESSFNNDISKSSSQFNHEIVIVKGIKIYRVLSTNNISTEPSPPNPSQILLLHGTKAQNVEGILKTGFEPSKRGSYGPGVYLTDSIDYAYRYGISIATENNFVKKFRYIFVNSVKSPGELLSDRQFRTNITFEDYQKNEQSVKMYNRSLDTPLRIEESSLDSFDSRNRKILKGSFQQEKKQKSIALAHHNLVVPAYLIEVEEEANLVDIVEHILYATSFIYQKTKKENKSEVSEYSLTFVREELKKKIDRIHHDIITYYTLKLETDINSIIKKLSIQLSNIFELEINEKRKFSTELLQKENDDYKFILRSFGIKDGEDLPKVRQLFKINPTEKNEITIFKHKFLYVDGIEADKVKAILTNGYPKDQNILKTWLYNEVHSNADYYQVDDAVKKLSFVFVVCSVDNYGDQHLKSKKIVRDSRGSLTREGLFDYYNHNYAKKSIHRDVIPAYLVIFEFRNYGD